MKKKKRVLAAIVVSAVCILAAGGIVCLAGNRADEDYIVKVNEVEVPAEEFRLFCARNRLDVMNYFKELYGADCNSAGFWETKYGNEIPAEVLKGRALEQVTEVKVEQIAAAAAGMVKDASYSYIMQLFREENEKRQVAYENGEIVMGKLDYEEDEFYFYVTGLMESNLKAELQGGFQITDSEVQAGYEENKDQFYLGKEKRMAVLSAEAASPDILQLVKAGMNEHKSAGEIQGMLTESQKEQVMLEERTVLPYVEGKGEEMDAVQQASADLNAGDTMMVYMDDTSFQIVTCLEEGEAHYLQEEYAYNVIRTSLTEERYRSYIGELLEQAQIQLNEKAWDRFTSF